jgi:hypothetical protein
MCSELNRWYEYVKENKGVKKDTYQFTLVLAKIFQYLFVHQKDNPQKPSAKVKITKEEMYTILENRKKATTYFPKNVFKRKNKVEEGGALGLGVKREQESTNLRAQKMMKGKVEPFIVLTMVREMSIKVQIVRQTIIIPQMTSP